ncbi:hypothetical protein RRG08_016764 [Elysia crispata]|uniref:Uncharacterized protein n=1 Tax=Elysia crispata TaxID=231223 RepID=A0AAE0ZZF6_9GAST|nr:hypothetical protein RRG08_016764 [Elysia crispata]
MFVFRDELELEDRNLLFVLIANWSCISSLIFCPVRDFDAHSELQASQLFLKETCSTSGIQTPAASVIVLGPAEFYQIIISIPHSREVVFISKQSVASDGGTISPQSHPETPTESPTESPLSHL